MNNKNEHSDKTPAKQASAAVIPEPNKITASTAYDFEAKNLTAYGGLLAGTEMARSQAVTIRSRLLKIGAQVKITVRRVWVHLSEAFPLQAVFWHAAARLRC